MPPSIQTPQMLSSNTKTRTDRIIKATYAVKHSNTTASNKQAKTLLNSNKVTKSGTKKSQINKQKTKSGTPIKLATKIPTLGAWVFG